MQRDADDLSATEQIRHAQEWAGGTGHLLHLWSAATRQALYPDIDQRIKARLTQTEGWRYDREHSRQVLQHTLRDAQLAGHDLGEIIERITAAPMDGARSVSSVLHDRLQRLHLPGAGTQRDVGAADTAERPGPGARAGRRARRPAPGTRRAGAGRTPNRGSPGISGHHPGRAPPRSCGKITRSGLARPRRTGRRGGITDPEQAVSLDPHPDPELEALRRDTVRVLEIAGEQAEIRAMSRGELEGQVLEGERAQATAPRDVSSQLRLTAQADADAWQQAADAEAQHDQVRADNARSLAAALAAQTSRLEAANARYEEWSARTASTREMAGKARPSCSAAARNRPPGEHQGRRAWRPGGGSSRRTPTPWTARSSASTRPPSTTASPGRHSGSRKPGTRNPMPLHPGANRNSRTPCQGYPRPRPTPSRRDPSRKLRASRLPDLGPADDGRAARLDELQARADEAARRIDAQRAELDASSEHTARIEREAQAGPEADRQAETPYEMEMEL